MFKIEMRVGDETSTKNFTRKQDKTKGEKRNEWGSKNSNQQHD
ncbi:hypothetical protein [Methanosphaera sp.]